MVKMRKTSILLIVFVACLLLSGVFALSANPPKPTVAEVEQLVHAETDLWNTNDPVRIAEADLGGVGFGFRTHDPRPSIDKKAYVEMLKAFFATLVYYKGSLDEVHAAVDGDIGMAWGFWTERFQVRGREPEAIRVRFSITYKHDSRGWQALLYHRDAQPFDAKGEYIPSQVSTSK